MTALIKASFDTKMMSLTSDEERMMKDCVKLSSEVWTGLIDGKVACVWGISPPTLMSTQAYLWLYSNDLIREHQFVFVRHSQRVIEDLLKKYDCIVGVCLTKAPGSIKWLKWLGAAFSQPDGDLLPFQIRKK